MGRLSRVNSSQTGTRERATGKLVLGLGALALAVSAGCLVTEQFEFAANDSLPIAYIISPPSNTRVPAVSDPACANGMRFDANIVERDRGQDVWWRLAANGQFVTETQRLTSDALGTDVRALRMCAPNNSLTKPCNHVQLLVTNIFESVQPPNPGAPDLNLVVLDWTVLGKSGEVPDAKPSDCVAPLMLDDAGNPVFPVRDGGR